MIEPEVWSLIGTGLLETLLMTLLSTLIAYVIGLPLGIVLVLTDKAGIRPKRALNGVLNVVVNILRSVPFLILLIVVIPFTRLIVGTSIGSMATVVPLVIAAFPFVARLVESSIREVDAGVIEAARAMGASPFQIVWRVMLTEARPSLVNGAAIAVTTILSYSAMAGIVGGGGLGDIAIRYGVHRYETAVMVVCVVVLVLLVQLFQEVGMRLANALDKRRND